MRKIIFSIAVFLSFSSVASAGMTCDESQELVRRFNDAIQNPNGPIAGCGPSAMLQERSLNLTCGQEKANVYNSCNYVMDGLAKFDMSESYLKNTFGKDCVALDKHANDLIATANLMRDKRLACESALSKAIRVCKPIVDHLIEAVRSDCGKTGALSLGGRMEKGINQAITGGRGKLDGKKGNEIYCVAVEKIIPDAIKEEVRLRGSVESLRKYKNSICAVPEPKPST